MLSETRRTFTRVGANGTPREMNAARMERACVVLKASSSYWESNEGIVDVEEKVNASDVAEEEETRRSKFGGVARAAACACAIAAFAYSDAAGTFPILAPAQTLARSFVDLLAAGMDYFVDLTLDAYDACVLGAISAAAWIQSLLLTPGSVVSRGSAIAAPAIADSSALTSKLLGMLCAKPFMSIAAVLLTLSRIMVSWGLAATEYACALLYATPVYVAVPATAAMYLVYKNRRRRKENDAPVVPKQPLKAAVKRAEAPAPRAAKAEVIAATKEIVDVYDAGLASAKWAAVLSNAASASSSSTTFEGAYGGVSSSAYSSSTSTYSSSASSATTTKKSYDFEGRYSNSEAMMGSYGVDQAEIERIYRELMPNMDDVYGSSAKTMPILPPKGAATEDKRESAFVASAAVAASPAAKPSSPPVQAAVPAIPKAPKVVVPTIDAPTPAKTAAPAASAASAVVAKVVVPTIDAPAKTAAPAASDADAVVAKVVVPTIDAPAKTAAPAASAVVAKVVVPTIDAPTPVKVAPQAVAPAVSAAVKTVVEAPAAVSASPKTGGVPPPVDASTSSSASEAEMTSIGGKVVKKGGSKEAFYSFVEKVSSIKTEDVLKVATETASKVATKETLEKVTSVATEVVSKVTSSFDENSTASASASSKGVGKVTLPLGTRKVFDGTDSSSDGNLSEGTVIKKKTSE